MENQDKVFKDAAGKAEDKGFARMDAVWNRVEEKLDNKKQRRIAAWWKYTGMAAVLLLFIGIGFLMLTNERNNPIVTPDSIPENNVTVIDTQKVKETFDPTKAIEKEEVVTNETVKPLQQKSKTVTSAATAPARNQATEELPMVESYAVAPRSEETVVVTPVADPYSEIDKEKTTVETTAYVETGQPLIADKKQFTGVITDNQGMPLPGAKVIIEGTTKIATTDFDGKYMIDAKEGERLIATYVGMQSEKVTLGKRKDKVDFKLKDDITTLDEVVVMGYGTTSRNELRKAKKAEKEIAYTAPKIKLVPGKKIVASTTNMYIASVPNSEAVTSVTSKTIKGRPNANFIQTLNGQVPGLQVTTGSGQPGSIAGTDKAKSDAGKDLYENYYRIGGGDTDEKEDAANYEMEELQKESSSNDVVIRGITSIDNNHEPLVVMNGLIVNKGKIKDIDPNNIASISVLKNEGATSIYGSRGSNGVIIVKTKNTLTKREQRKLERQNKKLEKEKQKHPEQFQPVAPEPVDVNQEEYESFVENPFENPATAPLSTFSIDVDNASYTNIRRFLNNGQPVPKDAVRVEEMINFFKYQYPQPTGNEPFSINTEYSDAPWNPQHKLLKIGLQGKIIPDEKLPASNFVFLIDVSGSMNEENKLPLLKESIKLLVKQMRTKDRIAIVIYAGSAEMLLSSTAGNEKEKIYNALDELIAHGFTDGSGGIQLAYKTVQENFIKGGNNRVILATDGDFNVGASSDKDMQTLIEEKRKSGVFLTCLGYGMGNYKDSKMETLADKGNGNYAYIDTMQEANRYLNKEFKGSMYAIAKDVKIQIEFNPKHVQSYRLIGYENRKLRDEDFANDAIDAGELGSGHTVTALYEIIPIGIKSDYFTPATDLKYSQPTGTANQYNHELATIKFRSKKPNEDKSTEIVKVIPNNPLPLQNTSGDYKFSAAVAWFGLKLRDSQLVPNKKTDEIKALAKRGLQYDPEGYRAEFVRLTDMVKQ